MKRIKALLLVALLLVASTVGAAVFPSPCTATNPTNCSRGTWGQDLRDFFDDTLDLLTGKLVTPYTDTVNVEKYASLAAAVTDIGSATRTLLIPSNQACSTAITTPTTLTVEVTGSGKITKSTGCTLTFNGPFEASMKQVFSGFAAGDVTGFGLLDKAHAAWWGAATSATAATNTTAIQSAIDAVDGVNATVTIGSGTYNHNGITIKPGVVLSGVNMYATTLNYSPATGDGITFATDPDRSKLRDVTLTHSGATTGWAINASSGTLRETSLENFLISGSLKGINWINGLNNWIRNGRITGTGKTVANGIGIQLGNATNNGNGVTVDSVYVNTFQKGIVQYGSATTIIRPIIEDCTTGLEVRARVTFISPWVGTNTTDIDVQAGGVLALGYGSQNFSVNYATSTESDRSMFFPDSLDSSTGPIKFGRFSIDRDGRVKTGNSGRFHIPVIPTASLPAAGTAEDGSVLIEDGGAGVGNFIIYKGGQRFRLTGTSF